MNVMFRSAIAESGFAVIPDVLTQAEILNIVGKLQDAALRRSRAGIRHLMSNADVSRLAYEPCLLALAREVLGSTAFPFRATLFDKSPTANWLVVWHQDTALPLRCRKEAPGWGPWSVKEGIPYAHAPSQALDKVVALRVHLDNSTEQNGPLRVLPGTHKLGVLTDHEVFESTQRVAVDCLVQRGAVLVMRPLLIHSSSKSQTDTPRRLLHIEYASSISVGDALELAVA
jgi:ectoine hydroxylase-related dioxygenase (phytanoyl-CoA dioxygenase family)